MSPWLRPLRADARIRLFCFPYAGGGVAEFARWRLRLPSDIEVLPLSLPGREGRHAEAPHRRVETLAAAISAGIGPAIDRPWAVYGHSMGAAVGFAVASLLCSAGHRPPEHLFFGARGGPGGTRTASPVHHLPEDDFLAALQLRYQAIPAALLADRALLSLFLPSLRADMEIAETAALEGYAPVPAPATVFLGRDDGTATPEDAARWAAWVGSPFTVTSLEGGHFFLKGPNPHLLDGIAAGLGTAAG